MLIVVLNWLTYRLESFLSEETGRLQERSNHCAPNTNAWTHRWEREKKREKICHGFIGFQKAFLYNQALDYMECSKIVRRGTATSHTLANYIRKSIIRSLHWNDHCWIALNRHRNEKGRSCGTTLLFISCLERVLGTISVQTCGFSLNGIIINFLDLSMTLPCLLKNVTHFATKPQKWKKQSRNQG